MKHLGDITKISGYDAPVVDCVIFGAPCQDLSVAGKRAGMKHSNLGDEEATRSGLFMEAVRIIKEMRTKDENERRCSAEFIRPRFAVYENVPGAFSSNKGEDFKIVLEELAKVIDKDAVIPMPPKGKWTNSGSIVGDGWSIAWRILDGQFWGCTYVDDDGVPIRLGTPQRRKRISLVADFGGECASEILFERKSLRGNFEESGSEGEGITSDTEGGSFADDSKGEAICYGISSFDSNGMKSENPKSGIYVADTSRTLDLNGGNPSCNQGGIAVVEPISLEPGVASREGGHIYEGVSGTLRANAGDNQMAVAYAVENHPADSRVTIDDSGNVQTLTGRMGTGGGNVPMVMEAFRRSARPRFKGDAETWIPANISNTLNTFDIGDIRTNELVVEAVGVDVYNQTTTGDVACALTVEGYTSTGSCPKVMVAVGIDCYNQAVTGDKAKALTNRATDSDHIPCVAIDRAFFNQGKNALYDPQVYDDGTVPTLVAKGPSAVCYAVDQGGGKSSASVSEDLSPTLTCTHGGEPAVAYSVDTSHADQVAIVCPEVSGTIQARDYKGGKLVLIPDRQYIVRRLTPMECERLQGYPDLWTDIGDFIDSKGKKKTSSDAVRYKALGNSICLPPWKWVLKRLCSHYERDATMASLFDGIGGFPYLWEQINGKGTAVWASEIEEFPVAVTKVRIG